MHESYLKTMIENARTGIVSVSSTGKVDIINRYAQDLLDINKITDIRVLEDLHPELYHFIKRCNAGDEKMVLIKGHSKTVPIAIKTSEFKQKTDHYKLFSFQNIESQLNEKEMLSWHKLMRVLTHEINNSISPIVSLSKSLEKLYVNDTDMAIAKKDISDKTIAKSLEGIQLISKRGEGLIKFVNNYKSITSLKQIDTEKFKVAELYYNLELLLKPELDRKHIDLQIDIKPFDLELTADKKYMEQVCINLLKNSIEATDNQKGKIKLSALRKNDKTVLTIEDNGKGIPQELMDQVFVPFFTTKEQGSGIGLSLAQQIMRLHGGNISVQSVPNKETTFTLSF
jgi:nitrogen fixation/metabolism regulation signal transduction histidine kinase